MPTLPSYYALKLGGTYLCVAVNNQGIEYDNYNTQQEPQQEVLLDERETSIRPVDDDGGRAFHAFFC